MKKPIDVCESFGARLRQLRIHAGLSQEAFAHKCGLDRTYISGIERGLRNVGLKNLAQISKSLKISLSELFEGVNDAPK
jgi:transcriptional regulator with XRE-family HTH domain